MSKYLIVYGYMQKSNIGTHRYETLQISNYVYESESITEDTLYEIKEAIVRHWNRGSMWNNSDTMSTFDITIINWQKLEEVNADEDSN